MGASFRGRLTIIPFATSVKVEIGDRPAPGPHGTTLTALDFEVVAGGLPFTGSLMAAAKLHELLRGRPITYRGQNVISLGLSLL
jgi:NAD/NADP transhydrogenase beta subunit